MNEQGTATGSDTRSTDGRPSGDLERMLTTDRRRSRRKKVVVVLVLLLVLGGGGVLAYRFLFQETGDGQPRYETEVVRRGDLKASITSTGTVEALNSVEVGAEISGKIEAIHVDFNDRVTSGQLLAVIDPLQQKAAVDEARAKMLAARAGVAQSKASLVENQQAEKRARALAERGLISSKDLEAAIAGAAMAKASLESAKASAALAQATYDAAVTKLDKTEIRSPIEGVVLSREVEVGQTINAGMQTPVLFIIAEDLSRMRISSNVDEADIGEIQVGQSATFNVDAFPDRAFESEIVAVRNVPITDQNVVSYKVLLTANNSELLLKPGMTATVDITTMAQKDALIVSNKALRFSPPRDDERFRGPPRGLPLLGGKGGGRPGGGKRPEGTDGRGGSLQKLGEIGAKQGVVWTLEGGRPRPHKVVKLASDGVDTAIESEDLTEGTSVIVELAEQGEE